MLVFLESLGGRLGGSIGGRLARRSAKAIALADTHSVGLIRVLGVMLLTFPYLLLKLIAPILVKAISSDSEVYTDSERSRSICAFLILYHLILLFVAYFALCQGHRKKILK